MDVDMNEMQRYIKGVAYPASKYDIIDHAKSQNADQKMIMMLEKLPDDNYESPAEVMDAMDGMESM